MISLKQFRFKLQSFAREHPDYMSDFDGFWKWKLKTETRNEHILDNNNKKETYRMLCQILPKWQTYRGVPGIRWMEILEDSLERMSGAHSQIRSYSLWEFSEVPNEPLELIWHELGRVKERGGKYNSAGFYHVISVCKPLMLLWGQTPAFDSRVRKNLPPTYWSTEEWREAGGGMSELVISINPNDTEWNFEQWKRIMKRLQEDLRQNSEVIDLFKE